MSPTIQFFGNSLIELSLSGIWQILRKRPSYRKFEKAVHNVIPTLIQDVRYKPLFEGKERIIVSVSIEDENRLRFGFSSLKDKPWCNLFEIELSESFAKRTSIHAESFIREMTLLSLNSKIANLTLARLAKKEKLSPLLADFFACVAKPSKECCWTIELKSISLKARHKIEAQLDEELGKLGLGFCEGGSSSLDDKEVEIHVTTYQFKGSRERLMQICSKLTAQKVIISRNSL